MIARDAAWIAAGQLVVVVAGMAGTRVLTTLLSPGDYGKVSLVMGLGALGTGLFCSPFLQASLRFFPDARDACQIGALRILAGRFLRYGVTAVATLLALGGIGWQVLGSSPVPFALFLAAAAVVACDAWRNYEGAFLNGARRQRDYALRAASDALARPALATALILAMGPAALPVVLGFALGSGAMNLLYRRRIVGGEPDLAAGAVTDWIAHQTPGFLKYGLPLVPMALLNWTMSMGDRYILAAHWGTEIVGVYWAAYALGSQPFIAASSLVHTTLRPVLYDAVARGDSNKERRTLRVWIAITLGIAATGFVLITVLSKPLCALLLGPAFADAALLLPWIAAAYGMQMVQQSFEIILFAYGRSRVLLFLQVVAALSAALLFILLIPRFAARGAAAATLGSLVITTVLTFILARVPARLASKQTPLG